MDFQGAIGTVQLTKQDEIHRLRRKNKVLMQEIFERIPGVRSVNELLKQRPVGLVSLSSVIV